MQFKDLAALQAITVRGWRDMELSLRLIAEIVLSAWLSSALLVAVMLQAASRPSPGYAAPLAEPEDDPYRFGAGASSSVRGPDSLDIAV